MSDNIQWMLSAEQLKRAIPKIEDSRKWMEKLLQATSYRFEINFKYHSNFRIWVMHINGDGCGSSYQIEENQKCWKQYP